MEAKDENIEDFKNADKTKISPTKSRLNSNRLVLLLTIVFILTVGVSFIDTNNPWWVSSSLFLLLSHLEFALAESYEVL